MSTKTITLKALNKQYEFVCNEYVQKFCNKQGLPFDYWVCDQIGGIATFIDQYFFGLDDIILDLNTKQPKGLIMQWSDDSIDFHFSNPELPMINYKSYTMNLRYEQLIEKPNP